MVEMVEIVQDREFRGFERALEFTGNGMCR